MKNMALTEINRALNALEAQLRRLGRRIKLVVCGGAALNALGLVQRVTADVDVLGIIQEGSVLTVRRADFPDWLKVSIQRVARDLNLPPDWMNSGPTSLVDLGLPEGLEERLEERVYGGSLTVYFLSRFDQIHLKLYAAVDRDDYHVRDLVMLKSTDSEIRSAALWSMTHDVSEGYRTLLIDLLQRIGYDDAAKSI